MKKLITLFLLFTIYYSLCTIAHSQEPPKRIISLAPNITEILFAIGLGDNIVGVTSFCDYPEGVMRKQKIGGMSNPSLEAIVRLKPDIVIMTTDGNPKEFKSRLDSLNIDTYVFTARKISELPDGIREMGAEIGVNDMAEVIAREIEIAINKFSSQQSSISNSSQKKKVLFIIWPEPLIVAGPGTAIDDAINLLGGENIASIARSSYPKYSLEEVIRKSPDVIFIGRGHANMKEVSQGLLERISMVPAVKNGSVFFVSDSLYRLGPRVINGIEELSECLN